MKKTVVLVSVLGMIALSAADPDGELLSNEILGNDLLAKGWDILESTQREFKEEGRGPFKKTLLPFLIGLTLKAGSLVPVKLMIMTFVVVMALVFAKLGLAISALLGYIQYQESHKAKLAAVTDKWFIPSSTHSPPIIPSMGHESLSAPSEPQPAVVPAPSAPGNGPNTKRLQHYQYDPYKYDFVNNDPYRFNRYDYPH